MEDVEDVGRDPAFFLKSSVGQAQDCCTKNPMCWERICLLISFLMESQSSITVLQRLSVERVKHNIADALQRQSGL